MSIETDLSEKATKLRIFIHQRTNNTPMRTPRTQDRVAIAMFQHSLDLVDGALVLVDNDLSGAALALSRPILEAYIRGIWALYCANEDEIEEFWTTGRPGIWELKNLADLLEKQKLRQATWIRTVMAELKDLNDLVHGGGHHLRGRIGAKSIEPRYPIKHIKWLIEYVIEVQIRVAYELLDLNGNEQGSRDLETYVELNFDRLSLR